MTEKSYDMDGVADMADRVAVMYGGWVVEVADVRTLFRDPRHPYTALLLASVPRLGIAPKLVLATISGRGPRPLMGEPSWHVGPGEQKLFRAIAVQDEASGVEPNGG
jgi:ABC-type dipeptide/oligopeptide/nickel transport system ATPase component